MLSIFDTRDFPTCIVNFTLHARRRITRKKVGRRNLSGNIGYVGGAVTSLLHYNDVIMGRMASQITSLTIVYSTVYSGTDQRKHQSSASLAFVREINRWQVNSPHKWPVTRKMFPFEDVIMFLLNIWNIFVCTNGVPTKQGWSSRPRHWGPSQ